MPDERERVVSRAAQYGRVPLSVLLAEGVSSDECRVYAYLTIYDFARTGECHPGRKRIADDLGWSLSKLDRALRSLEGRGSIERVRGGRGVPNSILLLADVVDSESSDLTTQDLLSRQIEPDESSDPGILSIPSTRKNDAESGGDLRLVGQEERGEEDPVRAVYEAWVESTGRTRTLLTPQRRTLIRARLRDGYSVEDLLSAARGWESSGFHRGENANGKVWNDLELIFRNGAQVERFRDAHEAPERQEWWEK